MQNAKRQAADPWLDGIGQRIRTGDIQGALAALLPEEKPKPKKKKRKPKPVADSAAPQDAAGAGSGFAYTPFR